MKTIQVDPEDPNNDQMLALTVEDMEQHVIITRQVLDQAEEQDAPLSSVVAVLAINWIEDPQMDRERLASLLSLSMVKNAAWAAKDEETEFAEFLKKIVRK